MSDSTNLTRRHVLQGAAGASVAVSLSGCTQQVESIIGGDEDDGDVIDFWSSPNEQELSFHEDAADEFSAENDVSIDVDPIPEGDTSEEVVLTALSGGTEADVYANTFPGFTAQLAENDAAMNLYDIDGVEEFLTERCGEEVLSRYESPGGHLYEAPWKSNPVLFQYNLTVFEEVGYDEDDLPRTLEELVDVGTEIVDEGAADVFWDRAPDPTWAERWFDFIPLYLAASEGEEQMFDVEDGETTPAFNNETAVTVLEFFQDLFENDLVPEQAGEEPLFPNDEAAINTGGPWVVPYFTDVNEDIEMVHLNPPVPDGVEENSHTFADPKNPTIFQSAEQPEEAWSFIEFEMGEEWDMRFLEESMQIPLREGIVEEAGSFFEENPDLEPYAEALETSHPPEHIPEYMEVMGIFGNEAFEPVARGNRSPQEGLDAAEEEINEALS